MVISHDVLGVMCTAALSVCCECVQRGLVPVSLVRCIQTNHGVCVQVIHVCMYACMYLCVFVCVCCVCICVFVCLCVCLCVCVGGCEVHACVSGCVHACVFVLFMCVCLSMWDKIRLACFNHCALGTALFFIPSFLHSSPLHPLFLPSSSPPSPSF